MINRELKKNILNDLYKHKVILILGARQVGKTTLVRSIVDSLDIPFLWLSGDEPDIRQNLSNISSTALKSLYGLYKLIVIDEAQRIENIGLTLKLSIDNFPDVQVIATGSSALELANKINEPLTGRNYTFHLHALSFNELKDHFGVLEEKRLLENRLIFGSYPEIITNQDEKQKLLISIADSFLYKDLFAYENIKKSSLFYKLVSALALQLGSEISYNELAGLIGASKDTVEKYIDLLEQAYVVFRLPAYSHNVRNELKKSKKIYFYDNGIRNAVINNFLPLSSRNDTGALWENYLISERIKYLKNNAIYRKSYFWRTTQQQEIDYIEEGDGKLWAYEFKWNENKKYNFPKTFIKNYDTESQTLLNRTNYSDFLI